MICPKCNTENSVDSKFCIGCGNKLEASVMPASNPTLVEPVPTPIVNAELNNVDSSATVSAPQNIVTPAPVQNSAPQVTQNNVSQPNAMQTPNASLNFFKYIGQALIKPIKTFEREESKLTDTKNSFILAGIVSCIMMLFGLIVKIINTVFVETVDFATYETKTTIDFSYLENLDWVTLIFKNLLIYAAIILGITVIYYLGSLVVKKSMSFTKTLSITATAALPYVALGMFISPILGKIWEPLSVVAMIGGAVYSLIIFYTLIKREVSFENLDLEVYFHLACMTILGTTGYYIAMKLLTVAIENELDTYLDMFS